jgi:hypothetical protein
MSNKLAFIVDMDGTLADHVGLRGHYEYSKVSIDRPIWPVITVAQALATAFTLIPIVVSGRMDVDDVRLDTGTWIQDHVGWQAGSYPLYMRAKGDYRPDDVVKRELYDWQIKDKYNVLVVLDDRDRVVKMWRELGLQCLQVAEGDF